MNRIIGAVIIVLGLTIASHTHTHAQEATDVLGSWTWKGVWHEYSWATTLTIRQVKGDQAIVDELVAVIPLPRGITHSPFGNKGIVGSFKNGRLIVINPWGATYDLILKGGVLQGSFIKPGMEAMKVEFSRDRAAGLFDQYFSAMAKAENTDEEWVVTHSEWCIPLGTPTPPHNGSTKTISWKGVNLECLLVMD